VRKASHESLWEQSRKIPLQQLEEAGWPRWHQEVGEQETLGDLVKRLRNAAAHGRVTFSSDSRNIEEVTVRFDDARHGTQPIHWRGRIGAEDLKRFCVQFIELIDETIG
jgi:hypothetical protein